MQIRPLLMSCSRLEEKQEKDVSQSRTSGKMQQVVMLLDTAETLGMEDGIN